MANKPSLKTLSLIFGDNAKKAREVLEATYEKLLEYPEGKRRHDECFNPPQAFDLQLNILNVLGEFHGVEGLRGDTKTMAYYLNAGEMYTLTLIYYQGRFRVQDLGTFIERNDKKGNRFL